MKIHCRLKAKQTINQKAALFRAAFYIQNKDTVLASTYSSTGQPGSTIGDEWLNDCVRDGNRCGPLSINAKTASLFQRSM